MEMEMEMEMSSPSEHFRSLDLDPKKVTPQREVKTRQKETGTNSFLLDKTMENLKILNVNLTDFIKYGMFIYSKKSQKNMEYFYRQRKYYLNILREKFGH